MERVILTPMEGGMYRIKPEGRESRPRTAYSLDEACLIVGGLAKAGFNTQEAEQKLMQACLGKVERIRLSANPEATHA